MASWIDGYVEVNSVTIHYYESIPINSSNLMTLPILLCLHGIMNSAADVLGSVDAFTPAFKVVVPDLRAHGESKPIPFGTFTMHWLAADQGSLIDKLYPGETVYIYGCSLGASVAARAINMYPNLFRAAVLEDPPWTYLPGELPDSDKEMNAFHLSASQIDLLFKLPKLTDDSFTSLWGEALGMSGLRLTESILTDYRSFDIENSYVTINLLSEESNMASLNLTISTALQLGDQKSGAVLSFQIADRVLSTYAQGNLQHFPNGTHSLHTGFTQKDWQQRTLEYFFSLG